MRQQVRRLAWLFVLMLGSVPPAQGAPADRYILRTTPGTSVGEILARYPLELRDVLDDDHDHGVFLVQASDALPAALVEGEVEADAAVLGFEALQDVRLPAALPSATLQQSTSAILDALADTSLVGFYDASARTSYVNQPAAALVRLPDVRPVATGSGAVVAIIDTGIDPSHPLLSQRLVPGYDFVRDIPGSASEMPDLDPSPSALPDANPSGLDTSAAVNQSTSAILDQSPSLLPATTTLTATCRPGP